MAKNNSTSTPIQLPLPIENTTVEIPLTKGYVTMVDAIDADMSQLSWYAKTNKTNAYAFRNANGHDLGMHKVILERKIGRLLNSDEVPDHINCDGLDNRRSNLRVATQTQNNINAHKKIGISGYKGVQWHSSRKTWRACLMANGKRIDFGYFKTPEEAYEAYKEGAKKYHGEFAKFD